MKTGSALGIIGGIFGILSGLFAVLLGTAFGSVSDFNSINIQGWIAIAASIFAIIASTQVSINRKRSGWLLIASGLVGLVAISFFYVLPCILMIIAGVTTLNYRKNDI